MKFKFILICLLAFNSLLLADHQQAHTHTQDVTSTTDKPSTRSIVDIKKNQVLVQVHGIVCSFCAFGVQKKLSKLDFVDHKKLNKGSQVDIENQQVLIAIKDNKVAEIDKIYASVKAGGYEPIASYTNPSGNKVLKHILE